MKVLILFLTLFVGFGSIRTFAMPHDEKKIVAVILLLGEEDNPKVITTIYTTLMSAEKVAKAFDIEMQTSETGEDVYIFRLTSEEQKDLVLKMFDAEGYELNPASANPEGEQK